MVGYLSFFFDLENFTDRAMIVLTTMLVIATITSTIQQVQIYVQIKTIIVPTTTFLYKNPYVI